MDDKEQPDEQAQKERDRDREREWNGTWVAEQVQLIAIEDGFDG